MKIRIEHRTTYTYSQAVVPGMHYLHFYPQHRPFLRTIGFDLILDPKPVTKSARLDPENNIFHQVWLDDTVEAINILAVMEVESEPFNPFDFILDTNGPQSAGDYLRSNERYLAPYLDEDPLPDEMLEFANLQRPDDPVGALLRLARKISSRWTQEFRSEEGIMSPEACFTARRGSCRDLTRMTMAMLRSQGYPCRYVSGYCYVPALGEGHELHAWLEVYLPGSGWLSVDPSLGLLPSGYHIPVAASFDPARTMPVQGFYHGGATSSLTASVTISELS